MSAYIKTSLFIWVLIVLMQVASLTVPAGYKWLVPLAWRALCLMASISMMAWALALILASQ